MVIYERRAGPLGYRESRADPSDDIHLAGLVPDLAFGQIRRHRGGRRNSIAPRTTGGAN
jgi:hypothetical protein